MDREQLLKEAKRRFPIGCTYYPVIDNYMWGPTPRKQEKECYYYEHSGSWIIGSCNIRTPDGVWAKIATHPNGIITKEQKSKILQLIKDI